MIYPNSTIESISELLFLETKISPSDLAIVLGNDYIKTMEHVHKLYQNHFINKIIITGHSAQRNKIPEAKRFFDYGLELGIPESSMILEPNATNSLENLKFTKEIIENSLGGFDHIKSILFIAKAFVCRRIEMTARALHYPPNIQYMFYPTVDLEGRNIGKYNWWKSETATKRVLEELQRIAVYTLKNDLALL